MPSVQYFAGSLGSSWAGTGDKVTSLHLVPSLKSAAPDACMGLWSFTNWTTGLQAPNRPQSGECGLAGVSLRLRQGTSAPRWRLLVGWGFPGR